MANSGAKKVLTSKSANDCQKTLQLLEEILSHNTLNNAAKTALQQAAVSTNSAEWNYLPADTSPDVTLPNLKQRAASHCPKK